MYLRAGMLKAAVLKLWRRDDTKVVLISFFTSAYPIISSHVICCPWLSWDIFFLNSALITSFLKNAKIVAMKI